MLNHRQVQDFFKLAQRVMAHEARMANDTQYRLRYEAELAAEQAELEAARDAEKKALQAAMKSDSEYFTSPEFREEVIEEIMANGATRLQAEGRTRDQLRLFKEARELGLM